MVMIVNVMLCAVVPQLKFMWGNLAVGSGDRWREVSVPFLQPSQVRDITYISFEEYIIEY